MHTCIHAYIHTYTHTYIQQLQIFSHFLQPSFVRSSQGHNSASHFPGATTSMSSLGFNAAISNLSSGPGSTMMSSLIKQQVRKPQVLISMSAPLDQAKTKKTKKKKKKKTKK